jgi:two-component system OmpR family response regulator
VTREPTLPPAPRVLLIDADAAFARFVATTLRLEGAAVDVAATGTQGLELAEREPPDLILLELLLPDMSGEAVLRRLRAGPAAAVPVVVVSIVGDLTQIEALRALGVTDVFTKPVAASALVTAVRRALANR